MACATVIKGSGNVFLDLGFSEEKSAGLMLKSCLLQSVQGTIKRKGWKQIEAAGHLGIDQAKVSKLLCRADGRIFHRTPHAFSVPVRPGCRRDGPPGSSWETARDSKSKGGQGICLALSRFIGGRLQCGCIYTLPCRQHAALSPKDRPQTGPFPLIQA